MSLLIANPVTQYFQPLKRAASGKDSAIDFKLLEVAVFFGAVTTGTFMFLVIMVPAICLKWLLQSHFFFFASLPSWSIHLISLSCGILLFADLLLYGFFMFRIVKRLFRNV